MPSAPAVADAGGDGSWSPGEQATAKVTVTNEGSDIFAAYPGITMTTDNPGVTSAMPSQNDLFGLAAGDSAEMSVEFVAAATVPPGTTVHITATVNSLNQTCSGAQSITFETTIE